MAALLPLSQPLHAGDGESGYRLLELDSFMVGRVERAGARAGASIRNTLIHEIGHAIRLDHLGPAGQVMGYRYTKAYPELQLGDLRGVRRLYGRGPRADNWPMAPTPLTSSQRYDLDQKW